MDLIKEFPIRNRPAELAYSASQCGKGDDIVNWVQKVLSDERFAQVIDQIVNISGVSNSKIDLIFTVKGTNLIKGIQVKTLSKLKGDVWGVRIGDQQYSDDTLMVFVNLTKSIFVLGFWKEFNTDSGSIRFTPNNRENKGYWFTDMGDFTNKFINIIALIPTIVNVLDTINGEYQRREYASIRKIMKIAESNNIKFEYHWTSDSPIDIYLNGHSRQCKSSTYLDGQLYTFQISKRLNGEIVPYSPNDVEYFVMHICKDYSNHLCIIPSQVLVDQKIIKTTDSDGKLVVALAPPDHYEYHWSESFWDNFQLFNGLKVNDPVYEFLLNHNCCVRNSSYLRNNKYRVQIKEHDLQKDYIVLFLNNGLTRLYKQYLFIIPSKHMSSVLAGSKKWIEIAPPDFSGSHWSKRYWKKISSGSLKPIEPEENLPKPYVPLDSSNVVLRELHYLQYELECLENVVKKQGLSINVKEITDQKQTEVLNSDPLMRELNVLQETINTLKLTIKRKQQGF